MLHCTIPWLAPQQFMRQCSMRGCVWLLQDKLDLRSDSPPLCFNSSNKDRKMTTRTAKTKRIEVNGLASGIQAQAKAAYAKGADIAGELSTITKGNFEACVTSGKILGIGLKELSEVSLGEGRQAINHLTADLKGISTVKSPAAVLQLPFKITQRNLDAAFALSARNIEGLGKLAHQVATPIATQFKANVAKLRKAD
jgi:hypothetical protein